MTRKQLTLATIEHYKRIIQIVEDSHRIVKETKKPDVFFSRLNLLVKSTKELRELEPHINEMMKQPTTTLTKMNQTIEGDYQEQVRRFLIKTLADTCEKARTMKTEKGQQRKFQSWYESLQEYYGCMNEENIDFVEREYRLHI